MHRSLLDRITVEPGKCGGRPCICGMPSRVKDVLEMLAARVPEKEILEDFPYLESADIDACLQYAAVQSNHTIITEAASAV
jgi:uncharacterized protein (DUF433 family)